MVGKKNTGPDSDMRHATSMRCDTLYLIIMYLKAKSLNSKTSLKKKLCWFGLSSIFFKFLSEKMI